MNQSTNSPTPNSSRRLPVLRAGVCILLLAMLAALPSIRGRFLGGDDKQLLLNNVLVNRPSLAHAVALLSSDAQRDLYQPVPLLLFSAEFAVVRALALPLDTSGAGSATALFHATNIAIHALNAVLVFGLFYRLSHRWGVGVVTAALFAIHPLGVESYAWLNGRMTLMSTTFSLVALLSMNALLPSGTGGQATSGTPLSRRSLWAAVSLFAAALAMCSKIQVGLPIIMLLIPLAQRIRPPRNWWMAWAAGVAMTAGFAVLNVRLSQSFGMFAGDVELQGSRIARTVIAVGWYLRSYLWPTHLSPYYPTDTVVDWSHHLLPMGLAFVVAATLLVAVLRRWSWVGVLGTVWFLATIAATLPIIPARNLMAADRYAYLPSIGLHWIVATVAIMLWDRLRIHRLANACRVAAAVVALGLLLPSAWATAEYYRTDYDRALRVCDVFPQAAGMRTKLAWACYDDGNYDDAIRHASQDTGNTDPRIASRALQVTGMAEAKLGGLDQALQSLTRAVELDPQSPKGLDRLARILEQTGQAESAAIYFRKAVDLAPGFNPAILSLAAYHRNSGDTVEARRYYEHALTNNAFDLTATIGLAELDIAAKRFDEAAARLERLLAWMPSHVEARTNLGVCYAGMNRADNAIAEYRRVLESAPRAPTATANLALLLSAQGARSEAMAILRNALGPHPTDMTLLITFHDASIEAGRPGEAVNVWQRAADARPSSALPAAWWAWSAALSGDFSTVTVALERAGRAYPERHSAAGRLMDMAEAWLHLDQDDPAPAIRVIDRFVAAPPDSPPDLLMRLRRGVRLYGSAHPDRPWPYYLMAHLLIAQNDLQGLAALDLFEQLCSDPDCRERAQLLRTSASEIR